MSKKSKKKHVSSSRSSASVRPQAFPTASAPAAPVAQSGSRASFSRSQGSEFNPDYSYVIKDLKRIGIMAGSFFLILIALSFFLR